MFAVAPSSQPRFTIPEIIDDLKLALKIVVMPGKDHGWPTIFEDFTLLADWFGQTLRGIQ